MLVDGELHMSLASGCWFKGNNPGLNSQRKWEQNHLWKFPRKRLTLEETLRGTGGETPHRSVPSNPLHTNQEQGARNCPVSSRVSLPSACTPYWHRTPLRESKDGKSKAEFQPWSGIPKESTYKSKRASLLASWEEMSEGVPQCPHWITDIINKYIQHQNSMRTVGKVG